MALSVSSLEFKNKIYKLGLGFADDFTTYHNCLVRTFDALPEDGFLRELALRIAAVAAAPILYPILGIGRLIAHLFIAVGSEAQTILEGLNLKQQIDALKKIGLRGWQQESMALIRKSRHDDPVDEMGRLKGMGVLTEDVICKLGTSISKVDSSITLARRNQILAIMGQALEIKSIYGDTYHVFIHAQASKWLGLNYLLKELHRKSEPSSNISHFKFLRPPCKLAKPGTASALWKTFRNTFLGEEKISNVREYIGSKWFVNDDDGETREHLISTDAYFFNSQRYESSLFFLINNSNILGKPETIKHFYKQIISYYRPKLSDKDLSRLSDKIFMAVQSREPLCGNLFTICVPKEISKDIQYRAHPFGSVCECHPKNENNAVLANLQKEIFSASVKCSHMTCPIPQFRLYIPMLKPGVTPTYLLTPYKKIFRKEMKNKIKHVVNEILNDGQSGANN